MGYALLLFMSLFALLMIPLSGEAASGAAEGLRVFALDLLPALFPFMVCANAIANSGVLTRIASLPRPFSGIAFAVICSLLGTPSSAFIFNELCTRGSVSVKRASVLCAALNLTGPMFIVSVLSERFFMTRGAALPFFIAHCVLPLLFSACYFRVDRKTDLRIPIPKAGELFADSIASAVSAALRVGGTTVFFFVLHAVFFSLSDNVGMPVVIANALTGILELTSGLKLFSGEVSRFSFTVCAFLLSFGGICIFIQSRLIFNTLSAFRYIITKLFSGIISAAVMWLIYPQFIKEIPVFSCAGDRLGEVSGMSLTRSCTALGTASVIVVSVSLILVLSFFFHRKGANA